MREASSLVLAGRLQGEGAEVVAYDPIAEEEARKLMHGVEFAASALDCVSRADAVVLVTEWQEFRELDWTEVAGAVRGDLVIDGRNALDPAAVRGAGLRYEGVGRHPDQDHLAEPAIELDPEAQPASTGSGPG